MPLNFNTGSAGSATGYVRYMASTASWVYEGENLKFTNAIFDLDNIKTGWALLQAGMAPEWVMDANLETPAQKPEGADWKRGFKVDIFSKSLFGDDTPTVEFGTSATGAQLGIQALYAEYEKHKEAGKVPVVKFEGGVPTKIGKGNTNVPTLTIVKWVDRPAELGNASATTTAAPAASQSDDIGDEF